jgi:DnaJ-class molecular chaperone
MNPYDVLGLPADASKFDVRNAYRQAAKKHHPDAGGDPEAFRDVTLAHDVLTDDLRRARFDETGQIDEKEADNHDAEATKRFLIVVSNALDRAQDMARQRNKPAFCFDVLGLAKIELIEARRGEADAFLDVFEAEFFRPNAHRIWATGGKLAWN